MESKSLYVPSDVVPPHGVMSQGIIEYLREQNWLDDDEEVRKMQLSISADNGVTVTGLETVTAEFIGEGS